MERKSYISDTNEIDTSTPTLLLLRSNSKIMKSNLSMPEKTMIDVPLIKSHEHVATLSNEVGAVTCMTLKMIGKRNIDRSVAWTMVWDNVMIVDKAFTIKEARALLYCLGLIEKSIDSKLFTFKHAIVNELQNRMEVSIDTHFTDSSDHHSKSITRTKLDIKIDSALSSCFLTDKEIACLTTLLKATLDDEDQDCNSVETTTNKNTNQD
jgi:hypothetical protein